MANSWSEQWCAQQLIKIIWTGETQMGSLNTNAKSWAFTVLCPFDRHASLSLCLYSISNTIRSDQTRIICGDWIISSAAHWATVHYSEIICKSTHGTNARKPIDWDGGAVNDRTKWNDKVDFSNLICASFFCSSLVFHSLVFTDGVISVVRFI